MRKFVAVVGHANAGKSTIIQSLTGCRTRTFRGRVTDYASGTEIEVVAASPQERDISESALKQMLRNAASRKHSAGVVIAIQPTRPKKRLSLEHLLDLAAQFSLAPYLFLLSPGYSQARSLDRSALEQRLTGYDVPVNVLNGKRFAHFNASIIRNTAGLF